MARRELGMTAARVDAGHAITSPGAAGQGEAVPSTGHILDGAAYRTVAGGRRVKGARPKRR
jgi:hypothetical protein